MKKILTFAILALSINAFAQQWTTMAPMPTARSSSGVAVVNNIIYVIGGCSGPTDTKIVATVEAYDPSSNTWSTKAPMSIVRAELGVAAVNGKIYAIGGWSINNAVNTVEEYDPIANTWTTKAPMPTTRSEISVGVINNKIYVVGGWPGNISTLEVYDPSTNKWTTKASCSVGRNQLNSCAVLNNKMFFIGGKNNYTTIFYQTNEAYDTLSNTWSSYADIPQALYVGAATVFNNEIHYLGGAIGAQPYAPNYTCHYVYNSSTNKWTKATPMLHKRCSHVAATVNGKIYVIGGHDSIGTNVVNWNEAYIECNMSNVQIKTSTPTTFCIGDSIALSSNLIGSSYTYIWKKNGTTISNATSSSFTAFQSGSYTLRVDSAGCNVISTAVVVTANPLPTVTNTLTPYINIQTASISLAGLPIGGTYSGIGIAGTKFYPSSAGLGLKKINYIYTDGNGCTNTALASTLVYDTIKCLISVTDTLIINANLTGIFPPNNINTVKVFPNPTKDHITINYGNYASMIGYTIKITNSSGQTVFTSPINQQSSYIDLSSWSGKGLYTISIIDNLSKVIEVRKIVLQ